MDKTETKKKTKFEWTEDKVAYLRDNYDKANSAASVKELAKYFSEKYEADVTNRSVISKLVHIKEYQTPEKKKAMAKDEGPTKKDILAALEASGKIKTEGADGATKGFLMELADKLEVEVRA